jgi:hypothetical protein
MVEKLKFKVGDWVIWTLDGDIGVIEEIALDDAHPEPYYISWYIEPGASGFHEECNQLELLGGHNGVL